MLREIGVYSWECCSSLESWFWAWPAPEIREPGVKPDPWARRGPLGPWAMPVLLGRKDPLGPLDLSGPLDLLGAPDGRDLPGLPEPPEMLGPPEPPLESR